MPTVFMLRNVIFVKKMQFVLFELLFLCYTTIDINHGEVWLLGQTDTVLICLYLDIINGGLKA